MFTGIIEAIGNVTEVAPTEGGVCLWIEAPTLTRGMAIGNSVAVNGACLTATEVLDGGFSVAAVPETLRRTNVGSLSPGSRVNLERAMPAGGRFEGHFVQGHVDATGKVVSAKNDGDERRLAVQVPKRLRRYVVAKGSITIDGVSLTVVRRKKGRLEVALIPHTLDATTLGLRQRGDRVNLEVDMIAKYVESVLKGSS